MTTVMDAYTSDSSATASTAIGQMAEVPGQVRQRRLALPSAVRAKLERIEAAALAARSEVLRLGDLLAAEREREQDFARIEQTWAANCYRNVTKADQAQLEADRAASAAELARLTSARDMAQERWSRLATVAEACRSYLGLPRDGRRS